MTDTSTPGTPQPTRSSRSLRVPLILAGLVGILVVTAVLFWRGTSDPAGAPSDVAAAPPVETPPALAETTGEEGTLRIEVVSLDRVAAGMVELRLAVTHVGDAATPLDIAQRFSADGPDRGTLAEVYLADLGHQRKLFILRDADGAPIGSRDQAPLAPGERRTLWARYPAPAEADEAVVVHVPHAEPMPNVPIATADTAPQDEPRPDA
jgi:hypothetical protein